MGKLGKDFLRYFLETEKVITLTTDWVTKPFAIQVVSISLLSTFLKEEVTELSFGRSLKISFHDISLCDFWHMIWKEFKELSDIAITKFMPSICLCE